MEKYPSIFNALQRAYGGDLIERHLLLRDQQYTALYCSSPPVAVEKRYIP
jgi:hypothetical protein